MKGPPRGRKDISSLCPLPWGSQGPSSSFRRVGGDPPPQDLIHQQETSQSSREGLWAGPQLGRFPQPHRPVPPDRLRMKAGRECVCVYECVCRGEIWDKGQGGEVISLGNQAGLPTPGSRLPSLSLTQLSPLGPLPPPPLSTQGLLQGKCVTGALGMAPLGPLCGKQERGLPEGL